MGNKHTTLLSTPLSTSAIVDTHTHLDLTFSAYQRKYRQGKYRNVHEFMRNMYEGRKVGAIVDVWSEAPVQLRLWRNFADSAVQRPREFMERNGVLVRDGC